MSMECVGQVSRGGMPNAPVEDRSIMKELNELVGLLGSTSNEAVLLAEALRPVSCPDLCTDKSREEKPRRDPSTALDYIEILMGQVNDLRSYLVKTRDMLVI